MLAFKILGGTPKTGASLCNSCRHRKYVRTQNGKEVTRCNAFMFGEYVPVPFPVYECSAHHPTNMPFLHEMEEIAWVIEARRRGPKGFADGVPIEEGEMEVVVRKPREGAGFPFHDPPGE